MMAKSKPGRVSCVCEVCGQDYDVKLSAYAAYGSRFCGWDCRRRAPSVGIKVNTWYDVNDDFFNDWSPDMAYCLGAILADGWIINTPSNSHLRLESKDEIFVKTISRLIAPEVPVKCYRRPSRPEPPMYCLTIGSRPLVQRLVELGIVPCKSNLVTMPPVPDRVFASFARGVFDGDGTVFITRDCRREKQMCLRSGFCGTPEFLRALSGRLTLLCGVRPRNVHIFKDLTNHGSISYSNTDSCLLFAYFYAPKPEDPSDIPHLPRKWAKFLKFKPYAIERGYWRA